MGRNIVACKGAEMKGTESTTIEPTPKQTHRVNITKEPSSSRTKRVAPPIKQTGAKQSCGGEQLKGGSLFTKFKAEVQGALL